MGQHCLCRHHVLSHKQLLATIFLFTPTRCTPKLPSLPLLYCLVVETLGQAIRKDLSIEGIQIPGSQGKQSKVSQYADDTSLILANNYSITRAFEVVHIFERGSGSHLNAKKTEGLWIGRHAGLSSGPVNITWVTSKLKILGVFFGNGNLDKPNWEHRVIKLEKRLNWWKSRTLSLKGKAMIVNVLGAAGLWYTATVLPMPDWVHTRITKAIFDFLWNGKTELVKRSVCQLPVTQGGLAVINPIEKARALKLRWVPCVGDPAYVSKWVYFARFSIGFPLSRQTKAWSFLRSNSTPKYIGRYPPMYFRHVLMALDCLSLDLTLLPDYKVRTFYAKLDHNPPTQLQCALAWEGRLNSPLPWPTIWSTMYGGLSTYSVADRSWGS